MKSNIIQRIKGFASSKVAISAALGLAFAMIFGSVAYAEFIRIDANVGYGYGYGYGDSGYGYGYGYGYGNGTGPDNGGNGGFTGGGGIVNGGGTGTGSSVGGGSTGGGTSGTSTTATSTGGTVLGASTDGASCVNNLILAYMRRGADNRPSDIVKLQNFLNTQNLGVIVPVTGTFDITTENAVNLFQLKYYADVLAPWVNAGRLPANTPTGYVYKTTLRWVDHLICPSAPIPAVEL